VTFLNIPHTFLVRKFRPNSKRSAKIYLILVEETWQVSQFSLFRDSYSKQDELSARKVTKSIVVCHCMWSARSGAPLRDQHIHQVFVFLTGTSFTGRSDLCLVKMSIEMLVFLARDYTPCVSRISVMDKCYSTSINQEGKVLTSH